MNKKLLGIIVFSILILTVFMPLVSTKNIGIKKNQLKDINYIQNQIVIKVKEGIKLDINENNGFITTGIESINKLNNKYNLVDIKESFLSIIQPKNSKLSSKVGIDRIFTLNFENDIDIKNAIEDYKKNPLIEDADFSGIGFGCIIPSDPNFNKQWGFHNTGQSGGTLDADIDAPEGWDIELGNLNVIIAIVDSGIDYNHEDLKTRIWINTGEDLNGNYQVDPSDFNGIDDDGNGFIDDIRGWDFVNNDNNPLDDHTSSHGTHCAGVAGANTNNNIGVSGTLWACQLMPVKSMYWNNNILWSDAGPGIVYAADNGADVISMSFSGSLDNITLEAACNYAYSSGCVLIAAIGNHGSTSPKIPAKYSTTIAVGATDRNDNRWSSSGKGNHIDVVAPGVEIFSTLRNNQYGFDTGTSMATPMVAGLAGLLVAQDPSNTNVDIERIITLTAEDQVGPPSEDFPGFDINFGNGRINAYAALYGAPLTPSKPSGPLNGKTGEQYSYSTSAQDPNDEDLYYWWDWGDGTNSGWDGPYQSGQQVSASHIWTSEGSYDIIVKVKDINNKESGWSDPLTVSIPRTRTISYLWHNLFLEKLQLLEKLLSLLL